MLRPRWILAGILIGLLGCALAGRIAAGVGYFSNFSRFFVLIQPQDSFFPTMSELIGTANVMAPRDKTLVLIGGSSIFRGTGQNPDELWSKELQKILGDEFVVLNYAIDQANATAFGGAAFRALRERYPKIIFVALTDLRGIAPIDGEPAVYRYLFWDGYYKKLFNPTSAEQLAIAERRWQELKTRDGIETQIGAWLDSKLYFQDLWSYVGYNKLFTVWNIHTSRSPFAPRSSYVDQAAPNLKEIQKARSEDAKAIAVDVSRLSAGLPGYIRDMGDDWSPMMKTYEDAFAPEWRSDVLLVNLRFNPAYSAMLTPQQQQQYDDINKSVVKKFRAVGFNAIDLGSDFQAADYIDSGHLIAEGGRRLAKHVAVAIGEHRALRTQHREAK